MKYFYILACVLACTQAASAQAVDTVLFENFQVDPFENFQLFALGDDTTWVNIDEDGLTPYDDQPEYYAWYHSEVFQYDVDSITGETNYCAASLSYMDGFAPGNRNWLITPPIPINNANYTLHWTSAPFQLPRYMDGCIVMAGPTNIPGTFPDTIYQGASMDAITGDGNSIALADFSFTPGYIHADSLEDNYYYRVASDSTLMYGYMEPHSVSLSAYNGQSIYIAFLHNSDDDYFFSIDDILVVSTTPSSTQSAEAIDFRFVTYPNPVANFLNVLYRLPETSPVSIRVTDMAGRVVATPVQNASMAAGEQQHNIDLRLLVRGTYAITLQVGDQLLTKMFVKK